MKCFILVLFIMQFTDCNKKKLAEVFNICSNDQGMVGNNFFGQFVMNPNESETNRYLHFIQFSDCWEAKINDAYKTCLLFGLGLCFQDSSMFVFCSSITKIFCFQNLNMIFKSYFLHEFWSTLIGHPFHS